MDKLLTVEMMRNQDTIHITVCEQEPNIQLQNFSEEAAGVSSSREESNVTVILLISVSLK